MASLISQMRNGAQTQLPSQAAIEQVKGMMGAIQASKNPQAMLSQLLQNNPTIATALRNGTSLQTMAQQMARERGIDLNQLIQQLQSNI